MQRRMVGKAEVVAKPDNAGSVGSISHQDVNSSEARWVHRKYCNLALSDAYYSEGMRESAEGVVQRYAVLYLATLIVLIPVDFLFLGIVAKGFFTSQVGDMLGEIRLAPAVLFYLLYVAGVLVFVSGPAECDLAVDAALWRAVRLFLLCDV